MSHVSWSEINAWNKCRRAHHFKYVERLKKVVPKVPMFKGEMLHSMLHQHTLAKIDPDYPSDGWDALEKYEKNFAKLFQEEKEEFGDLPAECERIFEGYLRYYKNDGLKYEGSEEKVETPLTKDLNFLGFIDKRAVDKQGRRWLMDHKFHQTIPGPDGRFHELQLVVYVWAWNRMHPDLLVDGVCWDYVSTTPPTEPELLKRGGLSRRKNIRCDRITYERAITRAGLKKSDYTDFLKTLDGNERMFFERVFLPAPSKQMIEQVVEDLRTTAILIQNLKGIAPRAMNKFNCNGCEFRPLCEAEVRGLDVNFVRKSKYQPRGENKHGKEDED